MIISFVMRDVRGRGGALMSAAARAVRFILPVAIGFQLAFSRLSCYHDRRLSAFQEDAMPDDTIRWTVSVSKATDIAVRSFLAQRGMKKGDLSKFIEDAVKWRVLDQTMAEARGKFADVPPEELESLIDEAVAATRQANAPKTR